MNFAVEGRYFPNSLYAFTFAQIQADRMQRPVEVHVDETPPIDRYANNQHHLSTWHATAHPDRFRRNFLVPQPLVLSEVPM